MPFVTIRLAEGLLGENAAQKKAEINRRLIDAISEASGIAPDLIWVMFENVSPTEWYVGYRDVVQMRKEQQG
jgi:4-oxalocrotonate tautomerase